MIEFLHTTGTWSVDDRRPGIVTCKEAAGSEIANTDLHQVFIPMEQKAANARLISSSPDLLKALIRLLPYLDNLPGFQQKGVIEALLKAAPELRPYLEQRQLIAA
jgi:hypothetical protein